MGYATTRDYHICLNWSYDKKTHEAQTEVLIETLESLGFGEDSNIIEESKQNK